MIFESRVSIVLSGLPVVKFTPAQAVAVLINKGISRAEDLEELNAADVLLAAAALQRQNAAIRELDRRIISVCRGVQARGLELDELVQLVRARTLVGPPPRLETFSGRGALAQWLRAVALTTVSHATRSTKNQVDADDDEALAIVAGGASPELRAIDRKRTVVLLSALERALKSFDADERTMLRLRFANGLTFDELAKVFGTHRTTAMRTLEKCHARLVKRFHEELDAAEISKSELASLSRLFEGSFVIHLQQVLSDPQSDVTPTA